MTRDELIRAAIAAESEVSHCVDKDCVSCAHDRVGAVIDLVLEEVVKVAEDEMGAMTKAASMAKESGNDEEYYKANTAWWSAARIAQALRARKGNHQ